MAADGREFRCEVSWIYKEKLLRVTLDVPQKVTPDRQRSVRERRLRQQACREGARHCEATLH